jgi:hypothetical protein
MLFLLLLIASCGSTDTAENAGVASTAAQPAVPAPPVDERDAALRPDVVIGLMGADISDMTIADLFAGDGYFTFKLIDAGANVIAVVNDPVQAEMILAQKKERGLSDARLRVRAVPVGDPGISAEEADMALIVHGFSGIQDKGAYFAQMRKGMPHPRPLIMLEWQNRETRTGPPLSQRMDANDVMDFIGTTGYSDVGAHSDKVPDHVVYVINDYFEPNAGAEQ